LTKWLWIKQAEGHTQIKRWGIKEFTKMYIAFQCANLDCKYQDHLIYIHYVLNTSIVLYQKANDFKSDGAKTKLHEGKLQAIQARYMKIYDTISSDEWTEVNAEILEHFREYDKLNHKNINDDIEEISVRTRMARPVSVQASGR